MTNRLSDTDLFDQVDADLIDTLGLARRRNATVAHALRAAHRKRFRLLIPSVAYTEWVRGALRE
jgi:hypothetical protein